jgi:hypothetical protein
MLPTVKNARRKFGAPQKLCVNLQKNVAVGPDKYYGMCSHEHKAFLVFLGRSPRPLENLLPIASRELFVMLDVLPRDCMTSKPHRDSRKY